MVVTCEICGSEHKDNRGLFLHTRNLHSKTTQETPIPNKNIVPKTSREIISDYLEQKLMLRLINDLDHTPDSTLKSFFEPETPRKTQLEELKDSLALLQQVKDIMPQSAPQGKTWPDLIGEGLELIPTLLEKMPPRPMNKPLDKPQDTPLPDGDYERLIKEKQAEVEQIGNSIEQTSTIGDKRTEEVSPAITTKSD